jgi:hypothetical protein
MVLFAGLRGVSSGQNELKAGNAYRSSLLSRTGAVAFASLLSFAQLHSGAALAWGNLGHRIVGNVATELAEEGSLFWGSNSEAVREFSNTPDVSWKNGPGASTEKPTHWFQVDFYSPQNGQLPSFFKVYAEVLKRYNEQTVTKNGTATWRVEQFYLQALKNLRSSQYIEALQLAGAMSHYIGDLSQPLHVTVNYDGQLTNQKGIHKFFETTNLEAVSAAEIETEVVARAKELMKDPEFRKSFDQDLMHAMMQATARSSVYVTKVLSLDKQGGRSGRSADAMREIAVDRLADGAATYAMILSRLWRDGGQVDNDKELSPSQPKWLAPDYSNSSSLVANGNPGRARAALFTLGGVTVRSDAAASNQEFADCQ